MDNTEDLISSLQTVKDTFDQLGIRYFVGGSVASSFHGAMRSTMDVDVVAELAPEHVRPILAAVAGEYYSSESAMRDAIQRRASFNLIHLSTSFKVDIFVSRGRPFDEASFTRSIVCRLGTEESGIDVPIASVEDNLLAKLDWFRAGNEASERQWEDVTRLTKLNREKLDWSYLEARAHELTVIDLLERMRVQCRIA
jgi:hypothetical protein